MDQDEQREDEYKKGAANHEERSMREDNQLEEVPAATNLNKMPKPKIGGVCVKQSSRHREFASTSMSRDAASSSTSAEVRR